MDDQQKYVEEGGPITFEDLGINRGPQLTDSALGKRREFQDLHKKEILFILVSFLSLLASLVLTIIKLSQQDISKSDFTFALVLLNSIVFCTYYLFHGVFAERPYEVLVLAVATFVVWIYIVVNYALSIKGTIKLVRLVASSVLSPVIIILGLLIAKLYQDSGKLIFRTVGANTYHQEMCKALFSYLGLLKFDLQLGISMLLLILTNGSAVSTKDIIFLSVGIPVTLVFFLLGYLCVRRENKTLAIVFLVSLLLQPAYIIYKTVTTVATIKSNKVIASTTFTCGALAMFIRILLVVYAIKVVLNFGNGLKEKVYGTEEEQNRIIKSENKREHQQAESPSTSHVTAIQ